MAATYRVMLVPRAELDLTEIDVYISQFSTQAAEVFLAKIHRRIGSLSKTPRQGGPAREADPTERDLRQITLGHYRVVYAVTERLVYVLRIGHSARESLEIPPDPAAK